MNNLFNEILVRPLANGLILLYQLLGQNLGVAIIMFSLVLVFALYPLIKPSLEAMKKIRKIQPEINKLKIKYKGDRQAFAKAQAELYKEKGINPSAGCLPQIIQIVILIALFQVFNNLLAGQGKVSDSFNSLLYPQLKFANEATINSQFLYLDVTKPDKFVVNPIPFPLPGLVLILAAVVQFLSAKISMPYIEQEEKVAEKTKGEADDFAVAMQSSMVYTLPLTTILFGMSFPSGLALYWFVFSLVQAYRQYKNFGWGGLTPLVKKIGL